MCFTTGGLEVASQETREDRKYHTKLIHCFGHLLVFRLFLGHFSEAIGSELGRAVGSISMSVGSISMSHMVLLVYKVKGMAAEKLKGIGCLRSWP